MKGVRDGLPIQIAAEWEIGQRMGLDVAVDDSVFRQSFNGS
jgi:hypothetical protein